MLKHKITISRRPLMLIVLPGTRVFAASMGEHDEHGG